MKTYTGTVIGLNTPKTAKVSVTRQWQHPLYKKSVVRTKNFACDIRIDAHIGDTVEIQECRPLSKTKHFKVHKVVRQGK